MKVKLVPYISFIIFSLFIFCSVPVSQAKSQGQIRAMKERADTVSKRKNRFVAKVLNQSGINYTKGLSTLRKYLLYIVMENK